MQCKDVMKTEVDCISPMDSAENAAQIMRDRNIGFVPVCDKSKKVIGTLTDRDIAIRLVAAGRAGTTPVRDIMSKEIVSCQPEDDISRAAELMGQHHKSRMLCMDGGGKVAGVISLSDIAEQSDDHQIAEAMRRVSSREAHLH
jgi:CBS domain-containing protein